MRSQNIDESREELELENGSRVVMDVNELSIKHLKTLMRNTSIGLDDSIRANLWHQISLRHSSHSLSTEAEYDSEFDSLPTNKLPSFVEPRVARYFALNARAKRHVLSVLWNLAQSCPHVTFAPLVYPLTSLFLHFHSSVETYSAIYSLINSKSLHFIGTARSDKSRDAIILVKLTNKLGILSNGRFGGKLGLEARNKLRHNHVIDSAFAEYLEWIFSLPFHHCVRIFDCFLVEGEKFLFRVALTLALLFEKHRKSQNLSLERMRQFCETISISPSELIACALKVTRISHKDIRKAKAKAEIRSKSVSIIDSPIATNHIDVISTKEYILGQRIAPRRFKSSVVNWNQLDVLWEWLPERVVVREPIVVFCSEENGNSLQTFYTLCSDYEPTILLIRDLAGKIFGAFCSSAWSKRLDLAQTKSGQYFGTGETFLFRLTPEVRKYDWVGTRRAPEEQTSQVSHSQQLFLSASSTSLCIGSGGGKFGLFIDESLTRGESDRCHTFDNEPLCTDSTHFNVSVLEVIAFC